MKRISPAVVKIVTDSATGSGVIYEVDQRTGAALILTNRHVIEEASRISAVVDDAFTYDAALRGFDANVDLAVLRICCDADFSAAQIVKSGDVAIGDRVYALGYPLGANSIRVTEGIVSASEFSTAYGAHMVQTDAALNPGNSGGPLIRSDGMVVGINTARRELSESGRPVEGTGFAIAARTVLARLPDLEQGTVTVLPTPTVEPAPRATPSPSGEFRQFGIDDGALPHDDDEFIEEQNVAGGVRNFFVSAEFEVPYSSRVGDWSAGFIFRNAGDGNMSYVALTQDGRYSHYVRTAGDGRLVDDGQVPNLSLSEGSVNSVALFVVEDRGWLFVNSVFLSDLDLSGTRPQGDLAIATGLFVGNEVPGYSTGYSNVGGHELGLLSGPASGQLTKEGSYISGQFADVDTATAYVRSDFRVPLNTSDWSSGFQFRKKREGDYLVFLVDSDGWWSVQHATITGESWTVLEEGNSQAVNLNDPILNTLELFFVGSVAMMYVNSEFLGTADISSIQTSGDVTVAYGIYANDLPGTAEFENFEVWGSPFD